MGQVCTLAPDSFAVGIDRAVGRTVTRALFGVSISEAPFTCFDFADDVAFLAELYDITRQPLVSLRKKHLTLVCV